MTVGSAVCSREVRNTAIRGGTGIYNALSKRSEVVVDAANGRSLKIYIKDSTKADSESV